MPYFIEYYWAANSHRVVFGAWGEMACPICSAISSTQDKKVTYVVRHKMLDQGQMDKCGLTYFTRANSQDSSSTKYVSLK